MPLPGKGRIGRGATRQPPALPITRRVDVVWSAPCADDTPAGACTGQPAWAGGSKLGAVRGNEGMVAESDCTFVTLPERPGAATLAGDTTWPPPGEAFVTLPGTPGAATLAAGTTWPPGDACAAAEPEDCMDVARLSAEPGSTRALPGARAVPV